MRVLERKETHTKRLFEVLQRANTMGERLEETL
jgi:hypothetical protein